jgi:excisionase family DNA binding protein/PAS domain S-box-containing protein
VTIEREKRLLTVKELADYLRVNQTTIYRLLRKSELPGFKVGGDWRFNIESIDAWRLSADSAAASRVARLPSLSVSDTPEATAILVNIHEAISQMLGPIGEISRMLPVLKRIADALEDKRDPYAEIVRLYRNRDIVFDKDAKRVVKRAPFATGVVDTERRFVAVSDEYCRLFNRSRKHFRTMRLPEVVSEEDRDRSMQLIDGLLEGKSNAEGFVGKLVVAKAPEVVVRARVWGIRTNRKAKPQYVTGILEPLANREQASAMFTRSAEDLSKRRESFRSRR